MVVGLIVFLVYLYFFIGLPKIMFVISNLNSGQYALFYSLALACVLVSVFFWSAAWNSILKSLKIYISYRKAYLYYWVGYFTDLVIPCATVCGELTRLYLVQKETQKQYGAIASSAVTNRIVAYIIVTSGLYVGASFIFLTLDAPDIIIDLFVAFLIGTTAYLAALLLLALVKQTSTVMAKIYLKTLKTFKPKSFNAEAIAKTEASFANFYDGFKVFRENPKLLIRPFIFHGLSYFFGLLVYVFIFFALGIPVNTPQFYIVIYFIATAVQDASASFSVGGLEILLATIFILYGISNGASGVTAIILRSASFWFPLLVGFICLQIVGAKNLLSSSPEVQAKIHRT
jgi:uncharacterized protein (TIRG00374 family)